MRHYEVVFMVHPDQSEQVPSMIERYRAVIEGDGGTIHRQEDWGRRPLVYSIADVHKAHYVLMNIEATQPAMDELASLFRFNDAVLRDLTIRTDKAVTDPSPMMEMVNEEKARERKSAEVRAAREAAAESARVERVAAEKAAAEKAEAETTESSEAESAEVAEEAAPEAEAEVAAEPAAEESEDK